MTDQEVHEFPNVIFVVDAVAQHNVIMHLPCKCFDFERKFCIKWIGDVRNNQTDDVGFAAGQAACKCVGTVALLFADFQNSFAGLFADLAGTAECAGNGCVGYSCDACDVFDGDTFHLPNPPIKFFLTL